MAKPFDSSTITRFQNNAEDDFATSRPCIIDRVALNLVAGTGIYNLPSTCIQIRRMTYLGWKVYPLVHRDLRQSYLSGTQQSRPYWYIFNNIGQLQVKLFPVPSATIALATGDLFAQPAILNGFIIEYFRMPDYTNNIIPPFYRPKILGNYQQYRSFAMEGQWQNLKASQYHYNKWLKHKEQFTKLLDDLNNKPRNLVATDSAQRPYGYVPPPPILPVDRYGISVDELGW